MAEPTDKWSPQEGRWLLTPILLQMQCSPGWVKGTTSKSLVPKALALPLQPAPPDGRDTPGLFLP